MTSLLFLRHGESTWNAARRWQGSSDAPLSDRGEMQAWGASSLLDEHGPFDRIITSSLVRARRTGELIAEATGIELGDAYAGLAERSAGEWEGLTRIEIEERYPGDLAAGRRPAGYETDESVVGRALAALDEAATAFRGRRLLVVSHGGVIHALERHSAGGEIPWERLDNLEGRWFAHVPGRVDVIGPRVSVLVDTTHLPALDEGYA